MKKIILLLSIFVLITYNSSAQLCLSSQNAISVGTSPNKIINTDLNGDGKMDLVTANSDNNTGTISIMLANSTGSYLTSSTISVGSGATSIASADFNSDGKIDLATTNGFDSLTLLLGNGLGGILSVTKIYTGIFSSPYDIISSDFNNDGKADLAVTLYGRDSIAIFLGNGNGSFSIGKRFPTGRYPHSIISADFNSDGKIDLATVNQYSPNFSVLLGNGSGDFMATTNFNLPLNSQPTSITSADFNGDNKKDLAISLIGLDSVFIFLGNGSGGFSISNKIPINYYPALIISPDINHDGKIDLIITTTSSPVYIAYGDGLGGFSNITYFLSDTLPNTRTSSILCADLNNDGKLDLTTTNNTSNRANIRFGLFDYTITTKKVTCNNGQDGSASVQINCGKPPFSYSWNTIPEKTTASINGLSPGYYSVKVTDAGNSQKTIFFEIENVYGMNVEMTTTPNTQCSGNFNGTAKVTVLNATPPFTYLWDSLANNQTTQMATALSQGVYNVKITDSNGCTSDDIFKKVAVIDLIPQTNPNIYLTNLAAIDQVKLSPAFASYYSYNLPTSINANPSNPRNFVDPGKKARFKVECTNQKANGQSIVSGICKVRSNSPYIKITDSSSALNNIGWSNKAWSADEFEIDIDTATPPGNNVYIDFVVQENGQDYATTCISIPVAPLVYSATTAATIDDDNNPDSKGNDNDVCEPNETIEFYPWLDNRSVLNAEYVRGRFENLDNHSFIKIWNDTQGVNTRVFDATWWNYSFAKPQTINFMSTNTTPEYDFVFDYKNNSTARDFKLYMVMAGGFKLFNGDALSLVQWSLPYSFKGIVVNDSLTINPQNLSYTSTASSKQVTINCNRTWAVIANQPWLTFNKNSGNGNDILTFNVTANTTNSQRTAIATFTAGSVTKTVTIFQDATVGINEVNKTNNITIYPNPSSGIFTISSTEAIASINVFDVTGKLVYSQQNNTKQTNTSLDLSNLSNGIYFINVHTENGGISNSKVVVSK